MINITVKTLDSQNHQFTVDDNYTVEQFKQHIANQVNIPASRQRIIYCGRVLQDNSKLQDYDVNGKVVHLVQRAPPTATTRNVRSLTPPPDLNRPRGGLRGFDRLGNAVYMGMGSMTLPQGLMDPQQMIPPRATHTLSASRLNVARRMLRYAENVIRLLENPSENNEQPLSEDPVEEQMTPVIEARVIVPSNGDQPIDENAIVNAVENSIFASGSSTSAQSAETTNNQPSSSSTPEASSRSASAENLAGSSRGESSREGARGSRTCRGTEMAQLLTTLNELQARFAPFLARYQTFMQEDPEVSQENLQETRLLLKRVSQVLHFLGHAYHSLSDIMINVDQPPPRLLLCRPILIQHSAVVQAGIPIQVEAQINLATERPSPATTTGSTSSNTTTNSTSSASATPNNNPPSNGQNSAPAPSITVQPGFYGLPFMPSGSMRVFTAPVEIHTVRPSSSRSRSTNGSSSSATSTSATSNQNVPSAPAPGQTNNGAQQPPFGANNGNLEFFMEVTPEVLRGGNLIQSLMQIVGSQLGGNLGQPQPQGATPAPDSTQEVPQNNAQPTGAQSQARTSTQTNPTTSTQTRSTPRPHVHMTQQAVQGGFDPFLPCYSHHIGQSRGQRFVSLNQQPTRQDARESSASGQAPSSTSQQRQQTSPPSNLPPQLEEMIRRAIPPQLSSDFPNIAFQNRDSLQVMTEALSNALRVAQQLTSAPQAPPQRGAPDGQSPTPAPNQHVHVHIRPPQQDVLGFISRLMGQNFSDLLGDGPTLDQYVQSLHPEMYVQGESLIIDLIMLMLRNLRLNDLFMITVGNMAPLQRQMEAIQGFFLNDICQNDTSAAGLSRATERVMSDFRPLITALQSIPPREDIDMVGTIDGFFRQRVPEIIRIAINRSLGAEVGSASTSDLFTTIWRAAKELLALTVHCSANGRQGVETVCAEVMFSTILNQPNIPADIHNWTIASSRSALSTIINNLDVRSSEVQQYVVLKSSSYATSSQQNSTTSDSATRGENSHLESMEVDETVVSSPTNIESVLEAPIRIEDSEPLPNVIWGSEPWHRQTPEDWVPIITRDVQKQRRQNSQPPFSDAYLAGMPSKRRKLIDNSKPHGSLQQVISDSVQQAVTATGVTSTVPLEIVAQAAGESTEIQSAYRTLLRSTVQANLRENEDFTPERFPNTASYFSEPPAE